jgi:uncharacterized tellurite resistance protein B-like protein
MQGFPAEADEAAVLLLMSVVRADQKVLKEELDSIQSFFSHQLQVSQERLQSIQEQIARYALEAIPEQKLKEALERFPESARHLLFSAALEIAMIDDELVESERLELLRIGEAFGLSEHQVQASLLEVADRREDAYSLLGVSAETPWPLIEVAYHAERELYSPARLAKLGVAFQSLALDRLERIEWAYRTLATTFQEEPGPTEPLPPRVSTGFVRVQEEKVYEPQELDSDSPLRLWSQLPRILEQIWRGSERDWDILQRRLALVQAPVQTREEIARDYDLSKLQVRQIENRGKRTLRSLLLNGRFHQQFLHATLLELCRTVFQAIQHARTEPVMTVEDYKSQLRAELGWEVFSPSGLFSLFEDWLEITRYTILGEDFVFYDHQAQQIEAFESACSQVHRYLKAQGGSAGAEAIAQVLYRKFDELRCSAEVFLEVLPGVQVSEDGLVSLDEKAAAPKAESSQPLLTEEDVRLGEFVENFFARSLHTTVSFRTLGLHIQDAARVPYRVATSLLRHHPAVSRERLGGRVYVGLRRDWRESLATRRVRFQPSVQELLDEFLRERLRGEERVALQELLPELQLETGAAAHELPSYVENSVACRVFERDGKKWLELSEN